MKKAELEAKLRQIQERLTALEELDTLVTNARSLNESLSGAQELRTQFQELLPKLREQKETVENQSEELTDALERLDNIGQKAKKLQEETASQLGYTSGAKLSKSFDDIRGDLIKERDRWLIFIFTGVVVLVFVAAGVVYWESQTSDNFLGVAFLLKVLITSPIVYFIVFSAREYSRKRNLVEEYRFKGAVAWSFEAYRKILEESLTVFDEMAKRKLDFVIEAIRGLYSSPMKNIKANEVREPELTPDFRGTVDATIE